MMLRAGGEAVAGPSALPESDGDGNGGPSGLYAIGARNQRCSCRTSRIWKSRGMLRGVKSILPVDGCC